MRRISSRAWILTLLSAALQVAIFPIAGPTPAWRAALGWVALAPFLLALLGDSRQGGPLRIREFALLGYFCGFLWYLGNCYWVYSTMHLYGGMSSLAAFGVMVLFCLYLGLYHALFAVLFGLVRCCTPLRRSGVLIVSPFFWVAVELARARITGFPWDQLGISQVDNALLTALAPVGGVYLLSFVLVVVNAQIAAAWIFEKRAPRLQSAGTAIFLVLIFQVGGTVLSFGAPPVASGDNTAVLLQPNLNVGAASPDISAADVLQNGMELSQHPSPPLTLLPAKSEQHRSITLWPESPAPFFANDPILRQQLLSLAASTNAPLIAGAVGTEESFSGRRIYNSAALFDPDAGYVGRYDKMHLVPFGEYVPFASIFSFAGGLTQEVGNFTPGEARTSFHTGSHDYGIFICYESIFADEVRLLARNGADVFVNISNDGWYGDTSAPFQHIAMARMRAIENRRWLLRDTNTGISASIDPYGRIVERAPRHAATAITVHFDYLNDLTFYTRYGDVFAYLCALVTSGFLLWALWLRSHPKISA
jgi:apolipoprotein N-acyltransferase